MADHPNYESALAVARSLAGGAAARIALPLNPKASVSIPPFFSTETLLWLWIPSTNDKWYFGPHFGVYYFNYVK